MEKWINCKNQKTVKKQSKHRSPIFNIIFSLKIMIQEELQLINSYYHDLIILEYLLYDK